MTYFRITPGRAETSRETCYFHPSFETLPAVTTLSPTSIPKVLFLDLDQVIVGPLDALVDYQGPLALLHTDTIACELASGGYNSSVISW